MHRQGRIPSQQVTPCSLGRATQTAATATRRAAHAGLADPAAERAKLTQSEERQESDDDDDGSDNVHDAVHERSFGFTNPTTAVRE